MRITNTPAPYAEKARSRAERLLRVVRVRVPSLLGVRLFGAGGGPAVHLVARARRHLKLVARDLRRADVDEGPRAEPLEHQLGDRGRAAG